MKLKELKKMIAEEYAAYQQMEQGLPELDPMSDMGNPMADMGDAPKVDVGPDDIKVDGKEEDPLATLKDIFDMLKDYFEGDDKPAAPKAPKAPKKDDDKKDDKEGEKKDDKDDKDDKKDDKEEMKESRKKRMQSKILAENKLKSRFKKLANIIK